MVAVLEEARAVGALVKTGWRPKRTIVYAAWDAEEPGLLGSTEWAETHAAELRQKLAVYINTDSNGRGFLGVGGSHTLEKFINDVARDVPDPQIKISVWERERAGRMVFGSPTEKKEARDRADLRIDALGSGSDYSPFLQHLGIASLNIGFGGENGGGSYHSAYDSFDHYTRFGDPNFDYGIALAKVCGRATLRLANADTLPFEFTNAAETIGQYVSEVVKLAQDLREETKTMNQLIKDGMLAAAHDPTTTFIAPKVKAEVPDFDFKPLEDALKLVQEAAKNYQTTVSDKQLSLAAQKQLDAILFQTERALMNPNGLPRRSWYRHSIYAPGFYTGYGVKTLPGVREAIEQRNWTEAAEQIESTAAIIKQFADEIRRAAKLFEQK